MTLNNLKIEIFVLCETKIPNKKEAEVWPGGPGARQDGRVSRRSRRGAVRDRGDLRPRRADGAGLDQG